MPNTLTTVGLNYLLAEALRDNDQIYVGLIHEGGWSAIAEADTMASHAGWEEDEGYSEIVRQDYDPAAPSGGVITNSASTADFSIDETDTLKGAFLASHSEKGGTTATLIAACAFTGDDRSVVSGNTVKVTFQLTAADNS